MADTRLGTSPTIPGLVGASPFSPATHKKLATFFDDKAQPLKRAKAIMSFLEGAPDAEGRAFYQHHCSQIHNVILDTQQHYQVYYSQKGAGKNAPSAELTSLYTLMRRLFQWVPERIHQRWQMRSFCTTLTDLVCPTNKQAVRVIGMELVCWFIDALNMAHDCNTELLNAAMPLVAFRSTYPEEVTLPQHSSTGLSFAQAHTVIAIEEAMEMVQTLFAFVSSTTKFEFWWELLKHSVLIPMYPTVCHKLGLGEDIGFRRYCPMELQHVLIHNVAAWLKRPDRRKVLLSSDENVQLLLEFCRQGFSLQPQYFRTTKEAVDVVRSFLNTPTFDRSPVMTSNIQLYTQRIIVDMSLVLQTKSRHALDAQVAVAREILIVYKRVSEQRLDQLSSETWELFLVTLLHVTQELLSEVTVTEVSLGRELMEQMLGTVFGIWMLSQTRNGDLWRQFNAHIRHCLHLVQTVRVWKLVVINLTEILCEQIYGVQQIDQLAVHDDLERVRSASKLIRRESWNDSDGSIRSNISDMIPIDQTFDMDSLKWTPELAFFMWDRMLHILGNFNKVSDPAAQAEAVDCVAVVVDIMLRAVRTRSKPLQGGTGAALAAEKAEKSDKADKGPKLLPITPSPNTLMELFGFWLCEACTMSSPFAAGAARAYGTLCKIICQRSPEPVANEYLVNFYRLIHAGLTGAVSPIIRREILVHSRYLFTFFFPAANLLIPIYLDAIFETLSTQTSGELRTACFTILLSVIELPSHYKNMSLADARALASWLPSKSDDNETLPQVLFDEIRDQIASILLKFIDFETLTRTKTMCLWGLYVMIRDDMLEEMPRTAVLRDALNKIIEHVSHVEEDVARAAADVLSAVAPLAIQLTALGIQSNLLVYVVCELCAAVLKQIQAYRLRKKPKSESVAHLMYTIADWLVAAPAAALSESLMARVFEVLEVAVGGDIGAPKPDAPKGGLFSILQQRRSGSTVDPPQSAIFDAAEALLMTAMNFQANFPSPAGWVFMGSAINEHDDLSGEQLSDSARHFSVNDDYLLTVVELPKSASLSTAKCRVILRDISGKYSWDTDLMFVPEADGKREGQHDPSNRDSLESPGTPLPPPQTRPGASPAPDSETDSHLSASSADKEPSTTPPAMSTLPASAVISAAASAAIATPVSLSAGLPSAAADDGMAFAVYSTEKSADENSHLFDALLHYIIDKFPHCVQISELPNTPFLNASLASETSDPEVNKLVQLLTAQAERETQYCSSHSQPRLEEAVPPAIATSLQRFLQSRMFLTHIGILSLENRRQVAMLESSERFLRALKELDRTASRELIKIGVIYVAPGQETQRTIMHNDRGSDLYEQFVDSLGQSVELSTHRGFLGGLDPSGSAGTHAPYYATAFHEVIFHVISRMPLKKDDHQQVHRKRHVGNDVVHIVWSDHWRDYDRDTISSQFNDAHVVLYPLPNGLVRIQVFCKEKTYKGVPIPFFGPLQDGMIIRKELVTDLVRQTAITANRSVRFCFDGYKRPFPTRRQRLNELIERCKLSLPPEMVLNVLMGHQMAVQAPEAPSQ
eukprot:TRINITY_DN4573_c0_g1_i1.p1 TRINITY_DN4573_c0_g1~~TRINITY_DN4573_c0_g1_i1.p1  ORF type:complete len:1547 (+),score=326.92 TRINITY_DN4573_c0_g1_i1:63-4703(+)